jgi:hypothetical protein
MSSPSIIEPARTAAETSRKKEWTPRIWEGCHFTAWMRLLSHNRFAVGWRCLYIAVIVTFVSCFHSFLHLLQTIVYGRRIARTTIRQAPIFIIGHWRTGTTFLHELLILDPRHSYPNTYQCLVPNHFLLTERLFTRWLWFLMPSRRPMDNMAAGWTHPQEDEFALCMLGQPSPYLTIAFPNRPPQYSEYLGLEGLSLRARERWKKAFFRFLQCLTLKDPRCLILKSPPHSCRIRVLLELFPEARFVHIVRDPYVVFPSTVNLWKALYETHGLQKPTFQGLEEYVFSTFPRIYEGVQKGRSLVAPSRFYELRYEDLVRDPVGEMRKLYDHLGLGGFDAYIPRLEAYLSTVTGYQRNRYQQLAPEIQEKISRRWGDVIRKYGYDSINQKSQDARAGPTGD